MKFLGSNVNVANRAVWAAVSAVDPGPPPGFIFASDDFTDPANAINTDRFIEDATDGSLTVDSGTLTIAIPSTGSVKFEAITTKDLNYTGGDFSLVVNYENAIFPAAGQSTFSTSVLIGSTTYYLQRGYPPHNMSWGVPETASTSVGATVDLSGAFEFTLTGTTLVVSISGTTYKTWTGVTGTLHNYRIATAANATGSQFSLDVTSTTLVDGDSNPLLIALP